MTFRPTLVLFAACSCFSAHAASSAGLTVVGSILPSACALTLGGAATSVADFGTLAKSTVMAYPTLGGNSYMPPTKTVALNILCDAALPIALQWTDAKAATKGVIGSTDAFYFGLGLAATSNAKIGAYSIDFSQLRVSTSAAGAFPSVPQGFLKRTVGSTGSWTPVTGSPDTVLFNPSYTLAFRVGGSETTPPPITAVTGNLVIQPFLLKAVVDPATTEIKLDGAATLNILYL